MRTPWIIAIVVLSFVLGARALCSRAEVPSENNPRICKHTGEGVKDIWYGADTLTYCEGSRGLTFGMAYGTPEGDRLAVPSESRWARESPEWAQRRRTEILETVRKLAAAKGRRVVYDEY